MGREDGRTNDVPQVSRTSHHDKLGAPDAGVNFLGMLDRGAWVLFACDDQPTYPSRGVRSTILLICS